MAGGIVLAILLGPGAFGVWAVGLGLVAALQAMTRSGLGATLVRRPEAPTAGELNALFTFQICFGLVAAAIGLALAFGLLPALGSPADEAQAICLALLALPISSPRVAPACVLERELRYVPLSIMDVAEQLALYGVAVLLAAAGAGIWSLAPAACASAAAGVAAGLVVSPVRVRPTRRLGVLRRIWRFGAAFQLSESLYAVRDGGLNLLLLTFAGASVTGVWALAQRLLVAPVVLFQTVGRVGFVAFSKVTTREEDERQAQQVLGVTALAAAALLATIVASAPALVGGVLGREWEGVILPATLAAVGWMVLGPLWVALWGLVQARGDLRGPLVGGAAQLVVLWTAAIVIAPRFGAKAIGAAFLVALAVTAGLLYVHSRRFVTLRLATLWCAAAIATVAAAAGRAVADQMPTLTDLPLAVAATLAVWSLLAIALMPRDLHRLASHAGVAGMLCWRGSSRT
ncbi:MAG: oligosaccharide flippase family protein [Actinobacteria bacterium]|nr:oligosaccharide flippase family protein [Actinomycetota bacterium]